MARSPKNGTPVLDMNPMVDLAFLLVTFFMLTTTFRMPEPVAVALPASTAETKLPERDVIQVTVAADGRVFLDLDGKHARERLLARVGRASGTAFSAQQAEAYALAGGHGMPLDALGAWLSLSPEARKATPAPGIPVDSARNELGTWIVQARAENPAYRVAIRADADVPYARVKAVTGTLLAHGVTRFILITETEPAPAPGPVP